MRAQTRYAPVVVLGMLFVARVSFAQDECSPRPRLAPPVRTYEWEAIADLLRRLKDQVDGCPKGRWTQCFDEIFGGGSPTESVWATRLASQCERSRELDRKHARAIKAGVSTAACPGSSFDPTAICDVRFIRCDRVQRETCSTGLAEAITAAKRAATFEPCLDSGQWELAERQRDDEQRQRCEERRRQLQAREQQLRLEREQKEREQKAREQQQRQQAEAEQRRREDEQRRRDAAVAQQRQAQLEGAQRNLQNNLEWNRQMNTAIDQWGAQQQARIESEYAERAARREAEAQAMERRNRADNDRNQSEIGQKIAAIEQRIREAPDEETRQFARQDLIFACFTKCHSAGAKYGSERACSAACCGDMLLVKAEAGLVCELPESRDPARYCLVEKPPASCKQPFGGRASSPSTATGAAQPSPSSTTSAAVAPAPPRAIPENWPLPPGKAYVVTYRVKSKAGEMQMRSVYGRAHARLETIMNKVTTILFLDYALNRGYSLAPSLKFRSELPAGGTDRSMAAVTRNMMQATRAGDLCAGVREVDSCSKIGTDTVLGHPVDGYEIHSRMAGKPLTMIFWVDRQSGVMLRSGGDDYLHEAQSFQVEDVRDEVFEPRF